MAGTKTSILRILTKLVSCRVLSTESGDEHDPLLRHATAVWVSSGTASSIPETIAVLGVHYRLDWKMVASAILQKAPAVGSSKTSFSQRTTRVFGLDLFLKRPGYLNEPASAPTPLDSLLNSIKSETE